MHVTAVGLNLLGLLCSVGTDPLPSFQELLAGSRARAERLVNLEVQYRVHAKYWPGQSVNFTDVVDKILEVEAEDTLKVMSGRRNQPWPWRCWLRREPSPEGKPLLTYFAWCTGEQSGFYVRRDDVSERVLYSSVGEVHAARGLILFTRNTFESFVWTDLNASSLFVDTDWRFSNEAFLRWRVVGRKTYMGLEVFVLRSKRISHGIEYRHEALVTGPPDYWMLRMEFEASDFPKAMIQEVLSLRKENGFTLPGSGRVVERDRMGKHMEYEFTVTSVKPLTEKDRTNWRPSWPPGTTVMDKAEGRGYRVPYPPEDQERLRRQINSGARPQARTLPGAAGSRGPLIYFNVALLALLALMMAIYRYKRYRRHGAQEVQQ